MSSQALIVRDDGALAVSWTNAAQQLKAEALEAASVIGRVSSVDQQDAAVAAQRLIKSVKAECEKARKAAKEPVLEFGRTIDNAAKAFLRELDAEDMRLGGEIGSWVTLQEAKRRAEEALRLKELADIERKRQEELAKAQSHEQLEAVQEKFNRQAAALPMPTVERARGQIVREEVIIDGIREFELMRARPDLVRKVEFDMLALKAELKNGKSIPGVQWHKETKSTVRAGGSEILELAGGAA